MSEELRRTPLYAAHQRREAKFVPFAGWEMPIQYSGVVAEHRAVRGQAGLFDVSHMGELWVSGDDAVASTNRLITNDLSKLSDNKALYTCCCNEEGTILDDLIVYRIQQESVLVVCNASNLEKIRSHFERELQGATLRDASFETALIAVQGPKAWDTLQAAHGSAVSLRRFQSTELVLNGHACRIARTGYTGEDGFELFCANDHAEPIWESLLEAGSAFGAAPAGLAARDTLRLEARLALYGNDITEETNPFEAGLGWTVKLNKPDFIGQAALRTIHEAPLKRQLVGFEMTGRGIARHGYALLDKAQHVIGECTSGAPSPTLGKNIGLGYVPVAMAEPETEIWVDCRGRIIPARVVETPFYRRSAA